MTSDRVARIRWLAPEEGGKPSPPAGPEYSTVARFESLSDRWPDEAWSVVLAIAEPADSGRLMLAGIRMLASEEAPRDLLSPGSRFELFEGARRVAIGEVI
jgi:hypothetical protein